MEKFKLFLEESLKNIDYKYVEVKNVTGRSFSRERVFCYELYHQMRCIQKLENDEYMSNLTIFGEMDKAGITSFKCKKPDFIFHKAETNENYAIMEIKNNWLTSNIYKDLETLIQFKLIHNYKYGFYLFYTYPLQNLKNNLKTKIEKSILFQFAKNLKSSLDIIKFDEILNDIYIVHFSATEEESISNFNTLKSFLERTE